jgi:hypothetical protein
MITWQAGEESSLRLSAATPVKPQRKNIGQEWFRVAAEICLSGELTSNVTFDGHRHTVLSIANAS